jgi:glucokinase
MTATTHAFGIDVGGTKIGLCLGDLHGNVIDRLRLETASDRSPQSILAESIAWLRDSAARHRVTPSVIGVASPGPLDMHAGRMLEVPNMPLWQGFPLRDHLREHADLPAHVMNDANASALAEWYWGAAKGSDTAVFLTMSTGMGAGLILGGRLFEGPLGLAGEIGHIRLSEDGPVGFGKRGSVEGYLSGPGIVQLGATEVLASRQCGRRTALAQGELTAQRILDCAREGDEAARNVVRIAGEKLGRLCAMLVDLLNPDVIVLGTIGTAHFDLFEPLAREWIDAEAIPSRPRA